MQLQTYFQLVGRKKQTLFTAVLLCLIIATGLTFLQTMKYASKTTVMVIQEFPATIDPYAVSKSNEYLSSVLARIIPTQSFLAEVTAAGFDIDKAYFPADLERQLKRWQKTVTAKAIGDTGMIAITVYHPDRYQSDQIVRAVAAVLKSKHGLYHGAGDKVSVRTVDQPITKRWPAKPNVPVNLIIGLVSGLVSGLSFIYLFPSATVRFVPNAPAPYAPAPVPQPANGTYHAEWLGGPRVAHPAFGQSAPRQSPAAGYQRDRQANADPDAHDDDRDDRGHPPAGGMGIGDDLSYEDIAKRGSMDNLLRHSSVG